MYRILDINNAAKERWKIVSRVISNTSSCEKTSPLNSPKLRRRLDSLRGNKVERRSSTISEESSTETLSELFSKIATEERKQSGNTFLVTTCFQNYITSVAFLHSLFHLYIN